MLQRALMVMRFSAVDVPDCVHVSVYDSALCESFGCLVNRAQVLALLLYTSAARTGHLTSLLQDKNADGLTVREVSGSL